MERVKDCKDVSIMSPQDEQFTAIFVYCNFLVLLSTTVCSQNINKQNGNIELFKKTISNSSLNSHVFGTPCRKFWKLGSEQLEAYVCRRVPSLAQEICF